MTKNLNIFLKNSQISFQDLYEVKGLEKLHKIFSNFFADLDSELFLEFEDLKNNPDKFSEKEEANILINTAKILEKFLIELFGIKNENENLQKTHQDLSLIYKVKKDFIQRQIARKFDPNTPITEPKIIKNKIKTKNITDFELEFAKLVESNKNDENLIEELKKYAIWALFSQKGQDFHENGALFRLPKKIDFENLVNFEVISHQAELDTNFSKASMTDQPPHDESKIHHVKSLSKTSRLRERDGFKLTDEGFNLNQTLAEANYCIFCHNQGKDSCKIGLLEKDSKEFKKDFFGQELSGCPLEERISEMNLLKSQSFALSSLAIAVIDNPMIAGTGHRICNDCMKSCIYQKQEPVDIPQIESKVLKDVLNLPYGFEIYSLLTRWNPLNLKNPTPKDNSGHKILIAGLGPAGYTLAHYLLNEGHLVVGIDGLKIEPLDPEISGIDLNGNRHDFKAIKNISQIYESLDKRPVYGFGGVAEYGITVRWDKNFLKIIRLLLERRKNFQMFGGVRLGSAFDCKDALNELNFDHVALCLGAGWPNVLNIKNMFAKGVRSASDFLMALQLTGAMHKNLVTNLQVRLPILVVGAGLTAIDTATESLAYYALQVEKFAHRYQILKEKIGKIELEKSWNKEEKLIALEFLDHSKQIKETRQKGESVTKLLQKLGGVKLIYRKSITDAPSYKTNHLEIEKALEEGLEIIDNVTPLEVKIDEFNHIKGLKIKSNIDKKEEIIAAKSLFVAIGTSPNKAPAYEDKLGFSVKNNSFGIIDLDGNEIEQTFSPKAKNIGFLAAKDEKNKKTVSFFGDTHKSFAGSVVKAMASAKKGYPTINKSLAILPKKDNYSEFLNKINQEFTVKVHELNILSENIFELVVFAPILARKTKLGHIFRLHNYHALAPKKGETLLAMEGVALTIYQIDEEKGLLKTIIINAGGSSNIAKNLKKGENIIFMGPSGSPAHISKNQNVAFIGAGRGVFPMASLAKAHKENGCKVTLFCGFRDVKDIVRLEELKNSCDELVISVENGDLIIAGHPNDESSIHHYSSSLQDIKMFKGNLVDAFINHVKNKKSDLDLIFTMGNEEMMDKIAQARHKDLKNHLKETNIGIASLNNPMQCMLKGICSQCLQKKIDTKTGEERYFYSCISQDQKMEEVDFGFLKNRCNQNSLQEKLTRNWVNS